jgi:hypothetical protein
VTTAGRSLGPRGGCSRSGAGLLRCKIHTSPLGNGGVQFGLSLNHPGPHLGTEGAYRRSQFSDRIADVLGRAGRRRPVSDTASLTAGRDSGGNAQTEPEHPLHRLPPFRRRPRDRRPDASFLLRLRRRIALLTP